MSNKQRNLSSDITIIKHYIKDLSFENLRDVNKQNFKKDEVKISDNINVIFNTYNDNNFSILLKYSCDCISKKDDKEIFIIEIDYFGLFKLENIANFSHDNLAKEGFIILYPHLKSVVEYISQRGAPINILMKEPDFNIIKG